MSKPDEDDAPDGTESEDAAPVVPEKGEGPIPSVAGDPRPPIGN